MPTPLEVELKQFAHNLVADHVKYEYDRQILRWQRHINLMVDAQKEAFTRHQTVLDEARKQIEAERQAAFGMAMLALSFVTGPVLSWIAGKIQYNWLPKYTAKTQERMVFLAEKGSMWGKQYHLFENNHDKVWAKVFGDLGKQVTGLGIDKALNVVTPSSGTAVNAVHVAATADETTFKSRLENAMLKEAERTSNAIMSLALSINLDFFYGAECLEKLRKLNPRVRAGIVSELELELLAKTMITYDIDQLRKKWADDWFFYGNDPGTTAGVAESIEREMWALWILNEDFRAKRPPNTGPNYRVRRVEGATFGGKGMPEPVVRRLADFGVIEARTAQQLHEQNMRRIEELRSRGTPAPAAPIQIGYDVDTASEIASLESWAKTHPVTLGAGHLNHRKRTLPSVENIHAS